MIELPHDAEPGTVVQEMQAGYMIKDRLVRPALVGVAKKAGLRRAGRSDCPFQRKLEPKNTALIE